MKLPCSAGILPWRGLRISAGVIRLTGFGLMWENVVNMCSVTGIVGWIETCATKDYISRTLKEIKYDERFIKMFCSPEDAGNREINYVFFGAEIDLGIDEPPYLYEYWLKRFENLIKKLKAHEAFVLVRYSHFDLFAVGYRLVDNKFIKEKVNLYDLLEDEDTYPLIFMILKKKRVKANVKKMIMEKGNK